MIDFDQREGLTVTLNNTGLSSNNPMLAFAGSAVAASLWLVAIIAAPEIQRSGLSLIVARIVVHLLLLGGAWAGLARTSLTGAERMQTWLAIAVPLTLWHASAWVIVANGLLRPGAVPIPLLLLMIVVPAPIAIVLLWRSRRVGALLDAMPLTWLIGIQFYRVVGATFLVGWASGAVPGAFALPAGTGDVITGLAALPVAASLASGQPGSARAALLWNLFGIGDLILAVTLGALTSPGPLQRLALDHPNLTNFTYPSAIIPAFTVPSSFVLHALSLRQLLRRARPAAPVVT
ncbi:hypothetical protein [Bradyrhizobium australafricanum]|uniref:hypothetical protein n=1 Tax=Bradyrhizobium australafricanum TaxID=2821406 RepID=UPI001CE2B3D9|nr:hypothetical protein [Bradyrhizobium australafricanum]